MPQEIKIIRLALPYRLGFVNCYLVHSTGSFLLIDTGGANQRAELEKELEGAGCKPDQLKLIVITHGDFDHTGNAAHLRKRYAAKIAMHPGDAGMAERGDMFWNRKKGGALLKLVAPLLFRFGKSEKFTPDLWVEDGFDFTGYGFDAQVIGLAGHSQGSIGILTADGDLFCGDLLDATKQPALNAIMDDSAAGRASLEKLRGSGAVTIYPGHGRPFPINELASDRR